MLKKILLILLCAFFAPCGGAAPSPVSDNSVIAVGAGSVHSLAVRTNTWGEAWGFNETGQLGDNSVVDSLNPVQVSTITGLTKVCGGFNFSAALLNNSTIHTWGNNNDGQLGNNTFTQSLVPVAVVNFSSIPTKIACGTYHMLGLNGAKMLYAWGYNFYGQLGNNTVISSPVPVQVINISGIIDMAAGGSHSLAVADDGKVYAWGSNSFGQLGNNTTTDSSAPVTTTTIPNPVTAVAAGGFFSLALKDSGTLSAWGRNNYGQLGNNDAGTDSSIPINVGGLTGVVQICAGQSHAVALTSGGVVWAWGYNSSGQLGDGTTTDRHIPTVVTGISNVTSIACGGNFTLAITSGGYAYAWGNNEKGQIGDGTTTNRSSPVLVVWE